MTDAAAEPAAAPLLGMSSAAFRGRTVDWIVDASSTGELDGVEWGVGDQQAIDYSASAADIARLARITSVAGLACCGLSLHDDDALGRSLSEWEWVSHAAQALGATHVRAYATPSSAAMSRAFSADMQELQHRIRQRSDLLAGNGLTLLLEPAPRTLTPTPCLAREALSTADPDRVGVVYDPGSLAQEGWVDPYLALGILGRAVRHVHVKNVRPTVADGRWGWDYSTLSAGIVDWGRVLDAIRSVGYAGWFVLDHLSSPDADNYAGDVAELRSLVRGTG